VPSSPFGPVSFPSAQTRSTTNPKGDNGDGTIVGPKEIEPHSYMSGKGCVNAGDEGLGSVSVQINLLKDFGDTDYCVLGYENLDCTGMMRVKHAINSANEKDCKFSFHNSKDGIPVIDSFQWELTSLKRPFCQPKLLR
jgi:hypothetical protein